MPQPNAPATHRPGILSACAVPMPAVCPGHGAASPGTTVLPAQDMVLPAGTAAVALWAQGLWHVCRRVKAWGQWAVSAGAGWQPMSRGLLGFSHARDSAASVWS